MADTTITIKIGDVSKQLTKASRLVLDTDGFWILTGDGQSVYIPAEWVRAYLVNGISPSVGEDGYWYVNGKSLGVKAEGVTPQLRGGTLGQEVSYDKGSTWSQFVSYDEIDIDLVSLEAEYQKVIQNEAERQAAEEKRQTTFTNNEGERQSTFEKNEKQRQSDFESSQNTRQQTFEKSESDRQDKFNTDETAILNTFNNNEKERQETFEANESERENKTNEVIKASKEQTDLCKELNDHQPTMLDNGNWGKWNAETDEYEDTGKIAKGGMMYPVFFYRRNKLYVRDYGSNTAQRVKLKRNKLYIKF